MAAEVLGCIEWELERDNIGHRDYSIRWMVETDDPDDGPLTISTAVGLPVIGQQWNYGNDFDPWALCWPTVKCTPVITAEPNLHWIVENKFTTRPIQRCQDTQIENPLAEPYKVSGSFFKKTKLVDKNKDGNPIRSSSQQRITGGVMEFDDNRPTIRIAFNQLFWPGALYCDMVDAVNDSVLWGLPPRTIKLSNGTWTRNLWGVCNFYFSVEYEFEVQYELDSNGNLVKTWDRKVHDKGTRCLIGYSPGGWNVDSSGNLVTPSTQMNPDAIDPSTGKANYLNPKNYEAYRMTTDGEPTECFLDGKGRPVTDADSAAIITVDYFKDRNFLLLDVPADLNTNLFP